MLESNASPSPPTDMASSGCSAAGRQDLPYEQSRIALVVFAVGHSWRRCRYVRSRSGEYEPRDVRNARALMCRSSLDLFHPSIALLFEATLACKRVCNAEL
jgi:hypothetical protein